MRNQFVDAWIEGAIRIMLILFTPIGIVLLLFGAIWSKSNRAIIRGLIRRLK